MTKKKRPEDILPKGRHEVITAEIADSLLQAFAFDASVREALLYVYKKHNLEKPISERAFFTYLTNHPDFAQKRDLLKDTPILKARQTVVRNLDDPDFALKYLERKKRAEFGQKLDIAGELEIKQAVQPDIVVLQELRALLEDGSN